MSALQEEASYRYLDYAATAPLSQAAFDAMLPYMEPGCDGIMLGANANSLSRPGRAAFEALERARKQIAQALGARRPDEIIFTSGATEADNAALLGIAQALARPGSSHPAQQRGSSQDAGHQGRIITSALEHDAVLNAARRLEALGFEMVYLKPDRDGFIEASKMEQALEEGALLVSIQLVNSEVGSIQPIRQLSELAHQAGALFHTDGTQGLGRTEVDLADLGVDAASFSGHKVGGPKGTGVLYLRSRTPFAPLLLGGGQESGKRSGTQNVCGAVGMAAAVQEAVSTIETERERLGELRDKLYRDLARFDGIQATVDVEPGSEDYAPHIVHVLVDGIESDTLVLRFDALGFAVSGGSACSSHSLEPSHVLRALGIAPDEAQCALRISLGAYTTDHDVNAFLSAVPDVMHWRR